MRLTRKSELKEGSIHTVFANYQTGEGLLGKVRLIERKRAGEEFILSDVLRHRIGEELNLKTGKIDILYVNQPIAENHIRVFDYERWLCEVVEVSELGASAWHWREGFLVCKNIRFLSRIGSTYEEKEEKRSLVMPDELIRIFQNQELIDNFIQIEGKEIY